MSAIRLIYQSDVGLQNIRWSADSKELVFEEWNIDWHRYSLPDNKLVSTPSPPIFVHETETQVDLAVSVEGEISFTFPSPDNRYVVYAAAAPADWGQPGWPLAITDTQTSSTQLIRDIVVYSLQNAEDYYNVHWSGDSSTFIVETTNIEGGLTNAYYIHGFVDDVAKGSIVSLFSFNGIAINDQTLYLVDAFHISDDGQWVLVEAIVDAETRQLVILSPLDASQNQAFGQSAQIIGGDFSPTDKQMIRYITDEGFIQHNLQFNETTNLDSAINAGMADKAIFSPDGQKVALIERDNLGTSTLYIVAVPDV